VLVFYLKNFLLKIILVNTKNIKPIIIINKVIIINCFSKHNNFILLLISNKLNFSINLIKHTLVLKIKFF